MLVAALVFTCVFIILVLVLSLIAATGSKDVKRTLKRLDSIALVGNAAAADEVLDVRRQEMLSSLPWLNRWLQQTEISPKIRLLLYQADVNWPVGRLVLMSVLIAAVAGYLIFLRTGTFYIAVFLGALAGCAPSMYVMMRRRKRFEKFEQGLPDAIDHMVAAIRAGHSFSSAMGMVANDSPEPIRSEFRQCFDEQNFGLELRIALTNLGVRVPIHDVHIIVTAVLIQKESGGNLTEILEKVGYLIRERFRLQRQIRVHTAQGRLTGWILSILPVALGVALYLVNPENMSILWTRPVGLKMLYAGGVMTVIGGLIIRKIVRMRV